MSHAPKLLALEAYAGELLSPRASAHLERHLATCPVCSVALAQVRAYAELRDEAAAEGVRAPSWERMAATLAAAPKQTASTARRNGKLIALAWPVLALAAALAIAWLGTLQPGEPASDPVAQRAVPSQPAAEARAVVAWISLLAGQVTLVQGSSESPLTLDSKVHEGDLLRTGPAALLHVQLSSATGFALAPDTQLRVARLREGDTLLELSAGRVTNQVQKLADSAQYRVRASELTASVRGTHFWVEQRAGVAVFVHEGRVDVARGDELLASLTPGQGYPRERFAKPEGQRAETVHFALPDLQAAVGLVLPPLPSLRAFIVDGSSISAAGVLAMRLPPGPTELKFEDLRGQIRSVQLDLTAPLTKLEPAALAELLAPKPGPVGHLSPEQISPVVRSAIEPLRRCYERNLRSAPALESKFVLRIRVSAEGRVIRAEVDAQAKLPIELERCIEIEAQKLVFPKPEGGGPLSFEVPLNLRSSR